MEDLTKLSGPELANALEWSSDKPRSDELAHEAARRLREDTRVWQRNLERERDGLRERVRELEAELSRDAEFLVSVSEQRDELRVRRFAEENRADVAEKRIAELEAQLREAQNAGADEWTADGEAVPEPAERKAQEERSTIEIGVDILYCATGHVPESRIIGNVRADEIVRFVRAAIAEHDAHRGTLAKLDAVMALAGEHRGGIVYGDRLLEVLNGKR